MNNSALSIRNLSVSYITAGDPVYAVQDVSFDIQQGEIFGLVGESGSGKSTMVQAILRTLPPPAVITGGKVIIDNKDILSISNTEVLQYRWKEISIVMQSALNALNPVLTIREQIKDVLEIHSDLTGKDVDNRIHELLSLIDIDVSRLDSYPHQLSGGMRQRVVIAIALALMPPLIIMDEPTTALDVIVEREILAKIIELRKELGFTILFITHDLNLLLEFADRLAIMEPAIGRRSELGEGRRQAIDRIVQRRVGRRRSSRSLHLRSRVPSTNPRGQQLLFSRHRPVGAVRPASGRGAPRRALLHDRCADRRSGGDRADTPATLRRHRRPRHRLDRQVGRRFANGICEEPVRRDHQGALSPGLRQGRAAGSRCGLRVRNQGWRNEQRVQKGTPDSSRSFIVKLPEVRPQPQHWWRSVQRNRYEGGPPGRFSLC